MSWDAWATETKEPQDPTWGDYGRTIQSGAGSAIAGTGGVLRWAFDNGKNSSGELWKAVEDVGNRIASDASESMTESGRKRFEAGITSPEFWEHPASSMALKATGQLPNVVAMGLPGGVINDARLAIAASTAVGGTLSAGDLVDGVLQKTDALPEDKLMEIPLYRGLRADMGEREARTEYNNQMLGMKPAIAFALGAGSDFFGPAANLIRGVKGEARHGVLKGAAEGFAGEAADEGYGAYGQQKAEIEGGLRKDYDIPAIIDQALTGGALGGVMSGATSIGGGKGKAKADEIRDKGLRDEDAAIQASIAGPQAAVAQSPIAKAAEAKTAKEGVTVGVDPAIKEALDEKTQKTTPEADELPVDEAQKIVDRANATTNAIKADVARQEAKVATPPPAAPNAQQAPNVPPTGPAAGVPNAQQTPPPSVVQPQQQVAGQPPAAAAPTQQAAEQVTPQVTPPGAAAPAPAAPGAAKPHLDENMLTELAKRGILPEEAAQLNQEQLQKIMQTPVSAPTDVSSRARTSEASAPTQVATAPSATQAEPFGTADPSASVNKASGIGPKGEKAVKTGNNKSATTNEAETARKALAETIHQEHTSPEHAASGFKLPETVPATPAERKALAAQLKPIVDELKTRMELREDAGAAMPHVKAYYSKGLKDPIAKKPSPEEEKRWHSSLPGRVGGIEQKTGEPRHLATQYLRELVDVQKILEGNKELGPEGKNRPRVERFFTAFNKKALDLVHMGRSDAAFDIRAARGGTTDSEAGALETGQPTGGVISKQSEGAASGRKELSKEEFTKAAMAALQASERLAAKNAQSVEAKEEVTPKVTPTKKELPPKVAEKVAITKKPEPKAEPPAAEQQQEEAPPPRKVWDITDTSREGFHEGYKPVAEALNKVRAWVNSLSDADHAKLSAQPLRMMQDANSVDTVHKIGKWFREDLGRGPFDGDEKIAAKAKAEQDEVVKDVIGEPKAEPKPAEKKGTIDIEMRRQLGLMGYSHGDIQKMTEARANHILDEGIVKEKAEAKPEAEDDVPEGLTAAQAKAFRKLTPEQRQKVIAALESRSSDKLRHDQTIGEMLDTLTPDQILARLNRREEMVLFPSEHDIWDTSIHKTRDIYGHKDDALSERVSTSSVLRNLDFSHLSKMPQYVQDFVRRRLSEVLDRVPLYFADNALVADSLGDPHHKTAGGYFTIDGNNDHGHIVINNNVIHDKRMFTHVVIHEAMHAALAQRIDTDAKFRGRVETLMEELNKKTSNHPLRASIEYAFENPHEFVSEAMSNSTMQVIMSKMSLDPEVARSLGIKGLPPRTLWGAFLEKVRETFKWPTSPGMYNFMDQTLRVIGRELERTRGEAVHSGTYKPYQKQALSMDALRQAATNALPNADTSTNFRGGLARVKDRLSSTWMLARRGAEVYGPSNPLHRLFEERAKQEHSKDLVLKKYGGLESAAAIAKAEREHPEAMAKAKDVLFDASLHDVNLEGSNDHLGKDKLMGVQAKNEIARLKQAWNDPAINPVRQVLQDASKAYRDIHNAVSYETINNILAEGNIHDPAMTARIHNEGLNEADRETYKDSALVRALDRVQELKRRQGTYVPFRRFGEFVSSAHHELKTPSNATKINDNTLQFVDPAPKNGTDYGDARARAAVKNYLRGNDHTLQGNKLTPAQIRKVFVDSRDQSKIVEAQDAHAIPAYRVSMQTQHTEMHATRAEALNNKAALTEAGLVNATAHSRDDAYTNARDIQGAMGTILRSLEKQQRYKDADSTQKAAMREMFHDLTLGLSGSTSIKNSMRQRRNVAGMSRDLGRVTADYARMTANHLAMLQHRPKIDKIFAEMRDYKEAHKNDNNSIRRDEIYKEFVDRIYGRAAQTAEEHKPGVTTRLLQMSRLSRLAGPSFHIINAHEPWTTSLPVIGGRHGFTSTLRALKDAYNIIGGRAGVMAGLKDTAKAYTNDTGFTDYVKLFKDAIGKSQTAGADKISRQQAVIDYMNQRNLYSNSAIFEVGKYAKPDSNVAGRALDRADLMANQVGSAIEAINRTVTGLTAYNLEYKRNGGNHEAAMHYAYTTAHETMGDYSSWNAAPIFNSPLGRVALQFKKFGHKTYYLLGNIMGGALRGDPQAMKQFAGLMVTHGLVAGALGLPTEPFKVALMAANAVGLTGFTPDDYDYAVRQLAARVAGQKGGEIISRGLYRGIGIEASGRLGLDSPFTYGAPKSNKDSDIKSFLFDTMAGAPVGFLLDQIKAAQAAFKGDFATAIEKASPLRAVGDITKAIVGASGPKTGPTGKETQAQFSPWETGVRALGFTPSSVAESGALRGTVAREGKRLSADRSSVINAWIDASGADKVKAQRAVQEFNADRPREQQIKQSDLTAAARRREAEEEKTKHGVTRSKRTKAIQDQAESVFNP